MTNKFSIEKEDKMYCVGYCNNNWFEIILETNIDSIAIKVNDYLNNLTTDKNINRQIKSKEFANAIIQVFNILHSLNDAINLPGLYISAENEQTLSNIYLKRHELIINTTEEEYEVSEGYKALIGNMIEFVLSYQENFVENEEFCNLVSSLNKNPGIMRELNTVKKIYNCTKVKKSKILS